MRGFFGAVFLLTWAQGAGNLEISTPAAGFTAEFLLGAGIFLFRGLTAMLISRISCGRLLFYQQPADIAYGKAPSGLSCGAFCVVTTVVEDQFGRLLLGQASQIS